MENSCTLLKKIILLGGLFFLYSCSQDEMITTELQTNTSKSLTLKKSATQLNVFKGPQVALGNGKVRSWISVDANGNPKEIGIEMTREALLNPERDKNNAPLAGTTIVIPLHLKASQLTPFDHIGINWNPNGHEPEHVFDVPHFDIHFYMISVEEQMAIPEWSPETNDLFNNYPPPGYMPADYFTPPDAATAEAQMGKHWLPVNLGDYLPFSKIMVYGSYNGNLIFIEPMITLDYLLSNAMSSIDYSQPEHFAKPGNYPTKYNIYHDDVTGNTYVTLSEFVSRD
ncbi:hypothetical protein [Flavobacterium granuli]|uniref:DUF5602 domain-containing protein n=1 Tax=Flavobacterium granuli TaxID=280093 RepID=A0A1M5J0F8_9FLAO|nr:hypothetical protein [Flavobacterium granuli]PRZ28177.1 hypothetical protein BC624_101468 [Flavobacterium granuli]SHG33789.1 hypothetical protein SAMN05443373_101468 [Flavobacterium granuli]